MNLLEALKTGKKIKYGTWNKYFNSEELRFSVSDILSDNWEIEPTDEAKNKYDFLIGAKVCKVGGDYRFDGTVVATFYKLSGQIRYVVEDDRGVLHIYSAKNLQERN